MHIRGLSERESALIVETLSRHPKIQDVILYRSRATRGCRILLQTSGHRSPLNAGLTSRPGRNHLR